MSQVLKTINEMLTDRGYDVSPLVDVKYDSIEELNTTYKNLVSNKTISIIYIEDGIGIDVIRRVTNAHTIIVCNGNVTSSAKSAIDMLRLGEGKIVEVFSFRELKHNKTKHKLVPKHELLSLDEIKSFLKYYGSSNSPKIRSTDPIAKYYGAQPKDVFKITRCNQEITYRVVI